MNRSAAARLVRALRAALAVMPAVLLPIAAATGTAQVPSAFADLSLPAGVPPAVDSLGKLVSVRDHGVLHVFSSCLRDWRQLAVGGGATTYQTNDLLLIMDGGTWTGFGASRGRLAPLAVGAGAQLVNALAQNNDSIALVRDGNQLHAFSGFTGRWQSRTVSNAATVAVQRHVAVLADGAVLAGFDAFTGAWTDTAASGPVTQLSCNGTAGVAVTATTVHGFSSVQRTWSSAPAPSGASTLRDDDWFVLHDGAQALAFSGLTGSFATAVTGPLVASTGEDLFGALRTSTDVWFFSAILGSWSSLPATPTAALSTSVGVALLRDAAQVVAWSASLGTGAALPIASRAEALAGVVVAAQDQATGDPFVYSALTGAWRAAPAGALPQLPQLSTTAAMLATANGWLAFSARSGAFVALQAPGSVAVSNEQSSPIVAWDAAAVHFFDGRRDEWLAAARTGQGPPNVQIWRTAVLVLDGQEALGFGVQAGAVHRAPLAEPVLGFRANSEGASVTTATHVLGLSAVPLPTSLWQFPDFRRAFVAGAVARVHLRMLPGDLAILGTGLLAAVPTALPGLGLLHLDPNALGTVLLLPEPDSDRGVFALPVPANPALRGAQLFWQALVLPAAGSAYLSDVAELRIG